MAIYDYAGSSLSLWPIHSPWGGLNFVSGFRKITHDILSVCLTRKGEDPIHPTFGLAPDIFDPMSGYPVQYWIYSVEEEIINRVAGIQDLRVEIVDFGDYRNELQTRITFTPSADPDSHVLTFGWFEYTGAIWNQDLTTFLSDVRLDSSPFFLTQAA
jgi:hypothetical protein